MTESDPASHIEVPSEHHFTNFSFFQLGNYTLSDLLFEPRDTVSHHRIWPYFFWVTFVVGLIGNGLVVFVYFRKKQIRSVTNTYLINLAITDVLYLLSTIPNKAVLMDNWPFGELMCEYDLSTLACFPCCCCISTIAESASRTKRCLWTEGTYMV